MSDILAAMSDVLARNVGHNARGNELEILFLSLIMSDMGHRMSGRKLKEVGHNVRCFQMFFIYTEIGY